MGSSTIRVARPDDVDALNRLIERSARRLSAGFYTVDEIEAAVRYVFGVDTTLIDDGTYFVAVIDGATAGCGGWSRRRTLYGGDQRKVGGAEFLDPGTDAARIRAFFVDPLFARRGVGRAILWRCATAARAAGFTRLELMATLPGVPLYAASGFAPAESVVDQMPNGVGVRFVRMVAATAAVLEATARAETGTTASPTFGV
jgi:GNAT superfamily N-acetyltransferase